MRYVNVSCSKIQHTQASFYKSTHVVLGGPLLQFLNKFVSFPHCRAPVSQTAFTARHINDGGVHCGNMFVAKSCEKEDGGSIYSAPLLARGNPAVVVWASWLYNLLQKERRYKSVRIKRRSWSCNPELLYLCPSVPGAIIPVVLLKPAMKLPPNMAPTSMPPLSIESAIARTILIGVMTET